MDIGRATFNVTVVVDEGPAPWPAILNSIQRSLGKLCGDVSGVKGISVTLREVDDEVQARGDNDAPEADNPMGE